MDNNALLRPDPRTILSEHDTRLGRLERRIDPEKNKAAPRPKTPFVTVAAAGTDPLLAMAATFQCDGSADQDEINAAVNFAVSSNSFVVLLGPTFNTSGLVVASVPIWGQGLVTVNHSAAGTPAFRVYNSLNNVAVVGAADPHTNPLIELQTVSSRLAYVRAAAAMGPGIPVVEVLANNCWLSDVHIEAWRGPALHVETSRVRITGLSVEATAPAGDSAGTVELNGDSSLLTGTLRWAPAANPAPLLSISGIANMAQFVAAGSAATMTAQVATISGADNLVIYTTENAWAADEDLGTDNLINPWTVALSDADIPATIARDTEVATAVADHAATPHGGTHPDLAAHDTLGLATQAELDAHAATAHGGAAADAFVPYYLGVGETFTVPEFHQALYIEPIELDGGTLDVEGLLIEVGQPPDLSALVHMGA